MTSRERIMAALSHQEPDRTPIFEYVLLPPIADILLGRKMAYGEVLSDLINEKGLEAATRQNAVDIVELAKILGHDMMYVYPIDDLAGTLEISMHTYEGNTSFSDPVEEITKRVEKEEQEPKPPSDEFLMIYEFVRQEMERQEIDLPILAPAYNHGVWTDMALMQTIVLDPELARRHFDICTKKSMLMVDKCLQFGIEMFGVGGDFAGNRGPLISPSSYREYIVPEVRKVSDYIHKVGKYAVNASDGDLWSILEDFLFGCGVDGYLEIDFRAGMNIGTLKEQVGSKVTLFGNIDCANLLTFGIPQEIKEHTKECLRSGWGNGGHILCANNAITESIPLENYLSIIEGYREFFWLEKFKI